MRKLLAYFAVVLVWSVQTVRAAEVPPSFADLVEKLSPAVVNISTTQKVKGGVPGLQFFGAPGMEVPPEFKQFFDQLQRGGDQPAEREVYSLGSGFIIDASGYVVTNNHVIAEAEEINVILTDDSKHKAKIIGRDSKTDLALLKIDAGKSLPYVSWGDSEAARVGDWVIAIGNPFGLGGTVTAGIISARARNINAGPFDDFIQTDAAINRGNSGGPMFNVKGEVIGVNTAIFSPTGGSVGIGFAVPVSLAKPVIEQLRTTGHIKRGWLGVKIQPVTEEVADSVGLKKVAGAFVMEVSKDSPAGRAGVKTGDIILSFDGKDVKDMRHLPRMVAETPIGKKVVLEVWREGRLQTLNIVTGKLEEKESEKRADNDESSKQDIPATGKMTPLLGMQLVVLTEELRERYGVPEQSRGLLVAKVDHEEIARRGIKTGDLITRMGDSDIRSAEDAKAAVQAAQKAGRKFMLVRVQRAKDEGAFLTLPLELPAQK